MPKTNDTTYKPYPKYKDRDVEWASEVPYHWEVVKLKRYFAVQSGDFLPATQVIEGEYPIYGGNGIRGYSADYNCEGPLLLIGRVGAKCGNIHLVNGKHWVSEHALKVLPHRNIGLPFFRYLLEKIDFNQFAIQTAQPSTLLYQRLLDKNR